MEFYVIMRYKRELVGVGAQRWLKAKVHMVESLQPVGRTCDWSHLTAAWMGCQSLAALEDPVCDGGWSLSVQH